MTLRPSYALNPEQLMFKLQDFPIFTSSQSAPNHNPALRLIAGDASDRKFFRLINDSKNAICMQFPNWKGGYGGDPISWIGMHTALKEMDIPIPKILEIDETNCCIWTEDLGDVFLNSYVSNIELNSKNNSCQKALDFYKDSLKLLLKVQYPKVTVDHPAINRFFDYEKLLYELEFFVTHFLNGFMQLNVTKEDAKFTGLYEDFYLIAKKLEGYEKVLCHRDYHSRNIMVYKDKIYWIDFQDARMGPHSYDVVSLLRDSYVDINWETRKELLSFYLSELNKVRIIKKLKPISEIEFNFENLLMGLQRNIKAIGSFGYLSTKKGKPQYLKSVKQTLNILTSKEAQFHEEIDLKITMPYLFALIEDLHSGVLAKKLDQLIEISCKE